MTGHGPAISDHPGWFTELCEESGSAFALQLGKKLHDETSSFQHIEVYQTTHFGNLLVLDGFIMLTARDNFLYHEMMVHPALFTHPNPQRVLVVGGGDCGCLQEILRHPKIQTAHLVELDERVTRVCESFFPELCAANQDSRAGLHFKDGIQWVTDAAPGSYDVIVVDSTDPVGQAARLFQAPFYAACHAALGQDGILVVQSESPLIHTDLIQSVRKAMADAGFGQITTLTFPQCTYPSGWWSATLAGGAIPHTEFREDAVRTKVFATRYYNLGTHRGALAQPEFMKEELGSK